VRHLSYGHQRGDRAIADGLKNELTAAITNCGAKLGKGTATHIRSNVLSALRLSGWSPEVEIDPASKISITSVKDKVGLCFQTGNMGRMYADLIKLQTVYLRETIDAGVLIVPTKHAALKLSGNTANFERLTGELQIFSRVITIPLFVLGIE